MLNKAGVYTKEKIDVAGLFGVRLTKTSGVFMMMTREGLNCSWWLGNLPFIY